MKKVWRVAVTEYLNAVRSKAFILGVLALPLIMALTIAVQFYAQKKTDLTPRRFAVLDRSGQIYESLAAKAKARNESLRTRDNSVSIEMKGQRLKMDLPQQPEFVPEEFKLTGDDAKAAELQLSQRVQRKELFAFVIVGSNILVPDAKTDTELRYHTETPTFQDLPAWLDSTINAEIRERRFTAAGVDSKQVRQLSRQVPLQRLGLAEKKTSGEVVAAKRENPIATHAVPIGAMMLLFMTVMSSAPSLLNTVLEEKMAKISEVLLASVSPFQLMLGKLFGTVLVSLTLSTIYLGGVSWMLWKFGQLGNVPGHLFAWFFLFQLLALLMFGSLFIAVGAACSEIRDAQNLMFPVMMVVMIPMLTWMAVLQSPASPFSRALSLFPPATPMIMFLRIAIPPGVPAWEIALGVLLTTLFMLGCVWASAKIFRIGILAQGQPPSIPRLIAWVFSK
ncbi:MAG: ABC transporter permease [Verrucomicrobia bacterium]|nr:ABC transporter permease [Verrucomicrobiota bacterium]